MIRQVEASETGALLTQIAARSAIGCKVLGLLSAYGYDRAFARFWVEEGGRAAYALFDGTALVAGTPEDPEESAAFLRATGAGEVLCTLRAGEAMGLAPRRSGDVLKKTLPEGETAPPPEDADLRAVYALLAECDMAGEFEPFYLDLSHRLRHGAACTFSRWEEGTLIGCAVVSAVTSQAAVLSAVAVREAFRGQGVGSALVRRAEQSLSGRTVYVFREKNAHAGFYKALGYEWCDAWVEAAP